MAGSEGVCQVTRKASTSFFISSCQSVFTAAGCWSGAGRRHSGGRLQGAAGGGGVGSAWLAMR